MSDDTRVLEGPDGMLYEIPADVLASYAVPGHRVAELRAKLAERASRNAAPNPAQGARDHHTHDHSHAHVAHDHAPLPPGHHRPPPGWSPGSMSSSPPPGAVSPGLAIPTGAPIVLNIYVGATSAPPAVQVHRAPEPAERVDERVKERRARLGEETEYQVEGYHFAVDEQGIPHHHSEMLWGDYIDKQGKPAVGYHSHDPVTGNAQ